MASASAKGGKNEPEVRPIIVKKIIDGGHGGHHGGAWKVAYADFVTAMMAFFLLLWIVGATDEEKRKGIADYFSPTLVELREKSAGSNGVLGGDSIIAKDNYPHGATQTGKRAIVVPDSSEGGPEAGETPRKQERMRFEKMKTKLTERIKQDPGLAKLLKQVRFTDTREGLRIDLVDDSDYSMFALGTDRLLPEASRLMGEVAQVIQDLDNRVVVRGHTDALPYANGRTMNNWMLSTARAEATRAKLAASGIPISRFARIEGVADQEPYVPDNRYDPRNRRLSITLTYKDGADRFAGVTPPVATKKPAT